MIPSIVNVLTVPPTEEPITLEQAKLYAGLSWTDGDPRDDLMKGFISAARSTLERRTGLAFLTQTHEVTYYVPLLGNPPVLELPGQCTPVQTLTADPPGLVVTPLRPSITPAIYQVSAVTWPIDPFTLTIVSGWTDPAALKLAEPALVHLVGLLTAHYATLGRDVATIDPATDVPHNFEELIAPFMPVAI